MLIYKIFKISNHSVKFQGCNKKKEKKGKSKAAQQLKRLKGGTR